MEVIDAPLPGCFVVKPAIFKDSRGFFYESFNQRSFGKLIGQEVQFVQDNQSYSAYGVLRGLHFQTGEHAQAKLVRVIKGAVLDIAVDLRPESPTFGQYFSVELSEENKLQLFIPRGFAHGFAVLSPEAEFFYKCDNFYHKPAEMGILYDDPELNIDWRLPDTDILISDKDKQNLSFAAYKALTA